MINFRIGLSAILLITFADLLCQENYEDSIQSVIELQETDSVKVNLLIDLAEKFVRSDTEKFYNYSYDAYSLATRNSYKNGAVLAAANLGYYHRTKANYDSSLFFYNDALINCKFSNPKLANIHYSIGNVYKAKGEFIKATESYLESLKEAERSESLKDVAIAQLGLGSVYLIQNKLDEALEFFLKTEDSFKKINDTRGIYISANNIGSCYYKLEKYAEAKGYFQKAKKLAEQYNDTRGLGNILGNLGSIFREENKYDSALFYSEKALEIRKKFKNKGETIISYHSLAETYIYLKNFKKAEQYLDMALELSEEIESVKELKFNWNYRAMLDTARRDYQSGFNSLQNYYSYRSKLEEKEVKSHIEELQTKYETEKKEAEIASLSQQASIQALEIQQKNQAIIIGIVTVLFVLVALYFFYKQRETKKQQSQTELEQRFLRSQLNPHFISNALVAVQSFMLKNDSESAALYLTKFSKLMREILENSRKEFIPVEEEINMLRNYLDIHKLRLGSFEYTIEIDDNIDSEVDTIPPMFVQPFVENAVEHGIGDLKEGGKIELKFKKEGDYISIVVNDNGKGLSPNKTIDHNSLSTTIIQERMSLFNKLLKNKIQLIVDNLRNEKNEICGTKVELKVPFGYV